MTPILYEKDEIDFTSQGLGSLVEIYDVDVQEQRNGLLQLTASYPVSGVRYADISVGRIILAKPNQRDDVHAFRIVSTELDIGGYAVTIEADSITYDLTHNIVKHLNISGNGQSFMTALKNAVVNPSIFEFYSDIATSSTTSLNYVNPMESIMGTTGSFLQIWGGELKRENRRVAMFNRRGRDNVSTFRLGKNISGLKYSVDISSLVTRIIPTKSVQNDDQTTTTIEGTPVDSQYINNYEQIYTLPLEFTDDTIKTVADLNAAAKGWFTQSANTGRDKPTVTIDIDVLSLQDSADYQDKFKNLESVSLTDTVTVYVPEYGVNVTAIVNELHYDPILDRVTKMTVGTAKQSFADSSRTQLSDLQDKIISVQNQADAAAVSANGKSKNYYGSVEPSHPQEGDTWFWVDGDKSGIKVFVNGDWVEPVDSDTQEKIANAVDEAVAQANAHTDEVKQGLSTDISTAKSQAASQASTAEANAKSAATSQFNQAQNDLAQAKTDITNAYKTADGVVNKKIDDTASSITTTINQNKQDADGKISTAQTTATTALNGLSSKVSQTDYDTKTGQLTTSVSKAQQTADAVTTSLANYKSDADGRISANSADIVTNANAIKQKVAQSDYDANNTKLTSRLTTVETTANGTATTVSNLQQTVNNLGQVNQLFNTEFSPDFQGWYEVDDGYELSSEVPTYDGSNVVHIKTANTDYDWLRQKIPVVPGQILSFSTMMKFVPTTPDNSTVYWRYSINFYKASGGSSLAITYGKQNYQTLDWTLQKSENIVAPANTAYVTINYYMRGAGEAWLAKPMLVFENTVGTYVQGNYNNNAALAQVKITADGINNFVRDSSGNISSDFQTALSKTSIITGSTLATSIQKQTATQITSALTDNNGKIISLINQDTSGVQIAGKNIVLDGSTTVTGDFYAKGGNFNNLNASNMTVGTLNGSQVNITNINASNITTGVISALTLSGQQYSIDLTKGEQKSWYTDISNNTYTTSNYKGNIQFTGSYSDRMAAVIENNPATVGSNPYPVINIGVTDNSVSKTSEINIYSSNSAPDTGSDGRKSVEKSSTSSQISLNSQTIGGSVGIEGKNIYIGQGTNGSSSDIPAPSLVQIYAATTGTIDLNAGVISLNAGQGDFNIRQDDSGGRVYSNAIYARTYSGSANMTVTSAGTLGRVTSASKYKLAITHYDELDRANKLLSIKPARWFDKVETEQYADELNGNNDYEEHLPVKPHFGLIAEDLVEAGLEEFVSYGADGEVEGLEYERVWTTLIPLIKNMKERIEELESKGK